jgi:hypothetical protein
LVFFLNQTNLLKIPPLSEASYGRMLGGGPPRPPPSFFPLFSISETLIWISVFLYFCRGAKMAEKTAEKVEKTVKTTITLADRLWRDVKVYAARKGLKLTQVVEAALEEYIREEPSERVEKSEA